MSPTVPQIASEGGPSPPAPAASPRTSALASVFDGGRRERVFFCTLAVLLVLLRSIVPTLYEGFHFDSDQATVGLMAKHLSEFRSFPLFYYGLNYMLAVEAWIVAPFFWIARPSVLVLRLPFVGLNALVAAWLITTISRRPGLRPAFAFAAALPFVMPTPAVAERVIEANGSCVEPFVYVLLLWALRRRPWAFGSVLAIAVLHREFVIAAVPALLLADPVARDLWSPAGRRRAGAMAAGFGIVWLAINLVRMRLSATPLGVQASSLGGQLCFVPQELADRARSLVTEAVPALFGATRMGLRQFALDTPLTAAGHPFLMWLAALAGIGVTARLIQRRSSLRPLDAGRSFAIYLGLVGLGAAALYPASCLVVPGQAPLLRYLLLGLLMPVGAFAFFLRDEGSPLVKALAVSTFVVWAGANLADNLALIRAARLRPPFNEHRVLADYLVGRHIRYARADYWDAYVVDFLSREKVTVASADVVRVPEYQRQVANHAASAVTLERLPCVGGEIVASWCIQRPRPSEQPR